MAPFSGTYLSGFPQHPKLTVEEFLEYPPSATAGFGLYTTNGSWLAGAAHMGNYKQDRIRYTGALAYTSLNLKFRTGIDIARGPEDWTIYLIFGHAWAF